MTLLYDAKIQENFLRVVRFYENAPAFLILNMKIKKKIFDNLDHIRVVAFSKNDFINTFKSKGSSIDDYSTNDLNKFSRNQSQNKLIQYYNQNFGSGFYNSYQNNNKTTDSENCIIDIDKNDMYLEKSNTYSLFITVEDTYRLLHKENNSNNNSVYFKIFIKDSNKNSIWTSPVITSPIKINDLITNANVTNELRYLNYFIKNDLQSATLDITDVNENISQRFLKINFPSGIANESVNNITGQRLSRNSNSDVVGLFGTYYDNTVDSKIVDKSKDITVNLSCKYDNISLLEKFSSSNVKSSSLYNFDRQFVQFSLNNVYEKIIEDYYGNNETFQFKLSLNVDINNMDSSYTIPNHTVNLKRSNIVLQKIRDEFNQRFIDNKRNFLDQIQIKYKNINTRIIQHKIDISNVKDKLSQISLSNLRDSFNNKNTIYLSVDNSDSLSNSLQIETIKNLSDLKDQVLEIENGYTLIFYTTTLVDDISSNHEFVYTFKYTILNNFETSHEVYGNQIYNADLDKINYKNKTLELNKLFKETTNIDIDKNNINVDISTDNSMILQINSLRVNRVDRFSDLSQFFGYESVNDFISSCIVRFSYTSKISKNRISFNQNQSYFRTGTIGYFEKFYNFNELFRVNDSNEITSNDNIASNLTFYEDLKNSSFNDLTQIKRSGIFDFVFSDINPKYQNFRFHQLNNPQATMILSYNMTIYPVPNLINKYKNKGLDTLKNVYNYFNNSVEAELIDSLFYDYIYDENVSLSFSEYLEIKESFFNPTFSLNKFYDFISKNTIDVNSLLPLEYVTLNNRDFREIINTEDSVVNNEFYNTTKAEFYVDRMFNSDLRIQGFPFIENSITKSRNASNINIIYNLPEFLKFDFDIVKSIKRINNFLDSSNVGNRFVVALNHPETNFEVRFALVPYVKLDDNISIDDNVVNSIKEQSNYLEAKKEGNITLLKPNESFYDNNQEYQTWNNFTFDRYDRYGEDSYSLTLNVPDEMLSHINYKNYFIDFFNEALRFNFTKLYDIRLNVALLITTPDIINTTGKNDYWCDYYQISLLNNETTNYETGMLNTIRFVQNV